MEQEPKIPQPEEDQTAPGYPKGKFSSLLVILGVLIAFVMYAQFLSLGEQPNQGLQEGAIEADVSIKIAYAFDRWLSSLPDGPTSVQTDNVQRDLRESAIRGYLRAVAQDPSPSNIRRLVILERPAIRMGSIERLARAANAPGVSPDDRKQLEAEVELWRDIYLRTDVLSRESADGYASRLRGLELGWYEHLALADLYRRAGLTGRADEEIESAGRSAARTAGMLIGMLAFLGILGTVGIVIVIWYRSWKSRMGGMPRSDQDVSADVRDARSVRLLEVFVVYMAVLIAGQIISGFLVLNEPAAEGISISTRDTIVVTAMHALAGIAALGYLARRLRSAGWSWDAVGLTSRRPLMDVLWGVGTYAAALPLLLIAGLVSQFVSRYVQSPTNPVIPMFVETDTLLGRAVLLVLIALAAPFFEEIFFRGVLFHSFHARWGVIWGVIASSAVFAVVHPLPVGFLQIFVLGAVFSIVLYERRSVLSPMIAHALNNTVAFVLLAVLMG